MADDSRKQRAVRRARTWACAVAAMAAVGGAGASAATASAANVEIAVAPGLQPEFDPSIRTYATRCTGDPVRVKAETRRGRSLRIDGGPYRRGSFVKKVALSEGQAFTMRSRGGSQRKRYVIRCLPEEFPQWTFERTATPHSKFFLTTFGNFVMIFNRQGAPVWFFESERGVIDANLLADGSLSWVDRTMDDPSYEIRNLRGKLKRSLRTVGTPTDGHDLILLENGNYLMMSYKPRSGVDLTAFGGPADATVEDAELQEITPAGRLVWSWNSKDHIGLEETGRWWDMIDGPAYDIIHINSAEVDGGSILVSMRHTDSIYSINRATGEIEYKLGGTPTPESLTVLGDPHGDYPLGGQHDARALPGGVLSAFDNGHALPRVPRGVQYEIDEAARTARLIDSVSDPTVDDTFCCGSSRQVGDGGKVVTWGGTPFATGFDPEGRVRFRLGIVSDRPPVYRVVPIAKGQLTGKKLRKGMVARYPRDRGA